MKTYKLLLTTSTVMPLSAMRGKMPQNHGFMLRHIDLFHRGRIGDIHWRHSHNQHFSREGYSFRQEQLQPFVPQLFLWGSERKSAMELYGCTAVVRRKRFARIRFDSQLDRLERPCHHQPERKYRCASISQFCRQQLASRSPTASSIGHHSVAADHSACRTT